MVDGEILVWRGRGKVGEVEEVTREWSDDKRQISVNREKQCHRFVDGSESRDCLMMYSGRDRGERDISVAIGTEGTTMLEGSRCCINERE